MTDFEHAVLALLYRAGVPCGLPYLDQRLISDWDIDLVVNGLLPACRELERQGFAAPTEKHGYVVTDAGRRYVETTAAALTVPHILPPDFVDDVLRLIQRAGGPNAGHPADQVYGYAVAHALTYVPESFGRREGWHLLVVSTQFRRAIEQLQGAGFIAEFKSEPRAAPRYAITDAGRLHLGAALSPPRESRGVDARTNPLYHPDV